MGRAYSDDLRERVATSVLSGRTCRATAELFGVSVASAAKWSQRRRLTGSAAARPPGRRQRPRSLATKPDVTLRALVAELGERGVVTSYGLVWRIVREAGVTFKKRR